MMNNDKEEDNESSDLPFEFEITERNKALEAANYAYAHSFMGILSDTINRRYVQLREAVCRFALVIYRAVKSCLILIKKRLYFLVLFIYNEYCNKKYHERIKTVKTKDNTKSTENTKVNTSKKSKITKKSVWHGIMGTVTLLVVVSIAYVSYTVNTAIDDTVLRVMTIPMSIWAAVKLFKQFAKQGEK